MAGSCCDCCRGLLTLSKPPVVSVQVFVVVVSIVWFLMMNLWHASKTESGFCGHMLSLSRIRITLVWLNSLSGIPYSNFILGLAHLSPAQVQSPVHTQIFFTWVKPRPNKKTELDQPGSESIRSVLEFPSGGVSQRVFDQPWCLWRVSTCVGVPRRVFNQRWCFTMSFRPVFEYSGVIQPYLLASTRFQWFLETFWPVWGSLVMFWLVTSAILTSADWF